MRKIICNLYITRYSPFYTNQHLLNDAGAIYDQLLFCDVLDNKHLILLYSIAEYNTSSKCHMKTNVILQKC